MMLVNKRASSALIVAGTTISHAPNYTPERLDETASGLTHVEQARILCPAARVPVLERTEYGEQ